MMTVKLIFIILDVPINTVAVNTGWYTIHVLNTI